MPKAQWAGDAVYAAAERFVEECLRSNGSLFTPGRSVWAAEPVEDFHMRFVVNEKTGSGNFMEKLEQQLAGASDETIQLAAEALFFNYLCEDDTSAQHKSSILSRALGWMADPVQIPAELEAALAGGLARVGQARAQKWQQMSFLLRFIRAWKALDGSRRAELVADHEGFRDFVHSLPKQSASVQIEGLLHLVFPDPFEPIVSPNVKRLIASAFGDYLTGDEEDVDAQLRTIRDALSEEHGNGFSFYDAEVAPRWQASGAKGSVGAWLVRGANNKAVDKRGENMLQQWFQEGFVSIGWPNAKPFPLDADIPQIRAALEATEARSGGELIRGSGIVKRFLSIVPGDLIVTPDSDSLYVARATGTPHWAEGYDSSALRCPVEWLNHESPGSRAQIRETAPGLYSSLKTLLTVSDLKAHIAAITEMLDGSGEAEIEPGVDTHVEAEVRALIPRPARSVAEKLLVTEPWLKEIVDLLNEKRQVVFYGPPGTGKTFVAQALAKHVRDSGGSTDLVQFHPAYSYEDFFEGYRPRLGGAGAVEFELRPGPLRRLADAARTNPSKPYLLIVDEINRGNIAKIFGELYFLLEYRNESIRLQYSSDEEFSLPDNLFVIGTMNTADRSIALVDSALRRRFYFVGFLPTAEPLRSVLRKWLARENHSAEAADYLEALNEALAHSAAGDEELAIGPSYFITRDGAPDLDRVWRHAIAPLLEERFFGARRLPDIEKDFSPQALSNLDAAE